MLVELLCKREMLLMRVRHQVVVGVALLFAFSLASPASAAPTYNYVDLDPLNTWLTENNPTADGVFDIVNVEGDCILWICDIGDFVVGTPVSSAKVVFAFFDSNSGDRDIATVDLGSDPLQHAIVDEDDNLMSFFSVNVYLEQIDVAAQLLAQLSETGTLAWKIELAPGNEGSVYLKAGALIASADAAGAAAHTPEPSAALLFCLGLSVVGTATRKHRMH
jgi:hypothetical protein